MVCAAGWGQEPAEVGPPSQQKAGEAGSTAAAPRSLAQPIPPPPPNWSDRRNVYLKRLFGLQAIWETVPGATFDTARGFPEQWGRTPRGFGKRVESQFGQFLVGETIAMGVSALHHEDPRYFRMPDAKVGRRIGHALASIIVTRTADGGGRTLAVSRMADVYGSWAVATLWNPPDQRNVLKIAKNGSLGLLLKGSSNLFREFWPDVKHRFRH